MPKMVGWKRRRKQSLELIHERKRNKQQSNAVSSLEEIDKEPSNDTKKQIEHESMPATSDTCGDIFPAAQSNRPDVSLLPETPSLHGASNQESDSEEVFENTNDDLENVELEISIEANPIPEKQIRGRRIVDINYFVNQLLAIGSHGPMGCTSKELALDSEKKNGLISVFRFRCKMCNSKFYVNSDCCDDNYVNVNCCAIAGTVAIGCGQAQLEELSSCLNLPTISQRLYDANHELVSRHWERVATQSMKQAAEEEKEIARKDGRLNKDGIPIIDVIADGCWSKRSFKKNYSAASGAAAIIGKNTGKILYLGVKNKYCQTCANAEDTKTQAKEHVCFKNYTGSSTGMESQILVEGFKNSVEQHGIIYGRLISDGDSSTYSKVLETRPYADVTVEKVECRNHVLRNFCNKLQSLIPDTKYPIKHRKLINKKTILTMRCVILKSIKKNKVDSDVHCLFEDILCSHLHAFGNHSKCKSYFCNRIGDSATTNNKDTDIPADFFLSTLWSKICSIVQSVAGHARSLFYDVDSNAVENFHSVVAKFVGGKRVNFSKKSSYQTRCHAAAVGFNTRKTVSNLYSSINNGLSPQGKLKKLEIARVKKYILNKKHKKPKRIIFSKEDKNKDSDYGESCLKPDIADEELEKLKDVYLKNLTKTNEQRTIIEKKTIHQSQSSEWLELRRSLLTASNFGKIIKMRPDTSCANNVKQLLYKVDLSHVASVTHGRNKEKDALRQLAEQLDVVIEPCGLFIDKTLPYFGATPDGVCGQDTIIEVKCPITAHEIGVDKAILEKKVTFWKVNKTGALEINLTHDWYYQVQGQLHITQRPKCIFAVWSNENEPLKTEIILKDDEFWRNKMEKKLSIFYMTCILPELVDPRHPRNMPIRDPPTILEAIKKKSEKNNRKKNN